jgi:predicted solute-binding protein
MIEQQISELRSLREKLVEYYKLECEYSDRVEKIRQECDHLLPNGTTAIKRISNVATCTIYTGVVWKRSHTDFLMQLPTSSTNPGL